MKNTMIYAVLILFSGCSFLSQGTILVSQKLPDGRIVQLIRIGGGATSNGAVWVSEKKNKKDILIDRIDYHNLECITRLKQVNDSIVMVTFIDTVYKFQFRYEVNLNNRVFPNDGSPGARRVNY